MILVFTFMLAMVTYALYNHTSKVNEDEKNLRLKELNDHYAPIVGYFKHNITIK